MLGKFKNIGWQRTYAFAVLMLLALYLLGEFVPLRFSDFYNTYGIMLIAILVGVYISRCGISGPVEIKLFALWFVWTLLTRWLNGDFYLFLEFDLLLGIIPGFLFFSLGTVLNRRERDRLLDIVSILYAGFFAIVALVGICVFITNTYIHIPPEDVWFSIRFDGNIYAPNYLSTSRLTSAPRFFIAWVLLLYQFVKRKNKAVRTIIAFFIAILYIAISLCHSRTTQIAMCAAVAMLALLAVFSLFKNRSRVVTVLACCILAAAALLGCYKGYDIASGLVSKAHNSISPAFATFYNGLENKIDPEYFGIGKSADELAQLNKKSSDTSTSNSSAKSTAPKAASSDSSKSSKNESITAVDNRNLIGNWSFTQRVEIWVSGLVNIARNPAVGVKGMLSRDVAPTVNNTIKELFPYIKEYKGNMHNAYMEVMMVTGLPGFLIIALWTLLLVKDMIKMFFSKKETVEITQKLLTLAMAGFLIIGLAETLLFAWLDLSSMAFYIISGAFLGYYYDSFPSRRTQVA